MTKLLTKNACKPYFEFSQKNYDRRNNFWAVKNQVVEKVISFNQIPCLYNMHPPNIKTEGTHVEGKCMCIQNL